ncbi:hypothetical protein DFH09DRAFT_1330417 [Mycena vulgaris]|nr:hypothetical protein DFH09DRAFT_1330417 [Mycena vulgaris]
MPPPPPPPPIPSADRPQFPLPPRASSSAACSSSSAARGSTSVAPAPAPKPAPAPTPTALPAPRLKKKTTNKGKDKASPKVVLVVPSSNSEEDDPGRNPPASLLEDGLNSVALLSTPAQQVPTFYAATTAAYSGRSAHYTLLALASAHADASLARVRLELEYYSLRLQALREGLPPPPPQMLVTLAPEYLNLFHHALEGLYDGALAARRPPLFDQTVLGQDTAPLDNPHAHYDPLLHPALGTSVLFGSPGPHRRDDHHNDHRDPAPDPYYDRCHADAFAPGHLFRNNICSDIEMDTASQGSAGVDSQGAEGYDADAAGDDLPLEYDDNDLPPP